MTEHPFEAIFSRFKPQFERVIEIIGSNWSALETDWQTQIGASVLLPEELEALTQILPEGAGLHDDVTFETFRRCLRQIGEHLADRHVAVSSALTALDLLVEISIPYLRTAVLTPESLAVAARRLYALAAPEIVAGYAEVWKSEQAVLNAKLERAGRRQHQASAYVTNIYEQERRRLSHDLHDDIGHQLLLLKLYLELIATDAKQGEIPQLSPRLDEALGLVSGAIDSVRRLILDLGPAIFDELGFLPAIRFYARQFSSRTAISVTVRAPDLPENIPASHQVALYRVLQGALSNVVEHARAGRVRVTIESVEAKKLIMIVEDNGVGFDPLSLSGRSFGLTAMRERVEVLGGRFQIESTTASSHSRKTGTRISIELPLPEGSAA